MTRELKLALIVGFSLVLFVMVLVSDHWSRARRVELPRIVEPASSSLTAIPPAVEIKPTQQTPAPAPTPRTTTPAVDPGSPFGPSTIPTFADAAPSSTPAAEEKLAFGALVTPASREVLPPQGGHLDAPVVIHLDPKWTGKEQSKPLAAGQTDKPQPAPSKLVPQEPVVARIPEYTVQEGDTLYELSRKFYKDPKHWKSLQAYNKARLTKDGQPRAGAAILVPSLDVLTGKPSAEAPRLAKADLPVLTKPQTTRAPAAQADPAKTATKTYKVQKNDTLTSIAQRMLGSHRRVNDLIKANPGIDPDNVRIGAEIKIPA